MKAIQQADTRLKREVDYRMSKWIITNEEQLLSPEEIEEIWRELLSLYSLPTASVENVCGTMTRSCARRFNSTPSDRRLEPKGVLLLSASESGRFLEIPDHSRSLSRLL